MPRYQYVQIGFAPETIEAIDEQTDNRSEFVREAIKERLDQ